MQPVNCINTNGPFAPGVAEWFYAFNENVAISSTLSLSRSFPLHLSPSPSRLIRSSSRPRPPGYRHGINPPFYILRASALIPMLLFPRTISSIFPPIEIDACLFTSLSPCVLARSSFPSRPASYSFGLPFRPPPPDMCLIFAATVDFRPLAPACAALVCICVSILRPFFSITLSRLSSPLSLHPLCFTPGGSFVTLVSACRRRVLRHISPSLYINFSSLLLSFPANDQYFVTFRLHTLNYSRGY
ncbi:hypothetical protein PUN28_003192 [Cardiocondyla obscurior]|uniref:Uncharacterized protein n=1 Tax=Cardiocondyla obscurior TaxID=286306 RepID=A0AAW2GJN8_9HYME